MIARQILRDFATIFGTHISIPKHTGPYCDMVGDRRPDGFAEPGSFEHAHSDLSSFSAFFSCG